MKAVADQTVHVRAIAGKARWYDSAGKLVA